jgi:glycogen debranching enzyme
MRHDASASRIRLRPRHDVVHISRGRSVLGMDEEGMIPPDSPKQGLFVYQTRMLSNYRWKMESKQPKLSTQSPVQQHSWLAYYYDAPPNCKETPAGECNPLQQTVELKISRVIGEGMHEDVKVTNHTQIDTSITLTLEADTDFVSRKEIKNKRKQNGKLDKKWRQTGTRDWEWDFQYSSEHHYDHQGNRGTARLQRGITLHLHADSEPTHSDGSISFTIQLPPHGSWRACLKWQPQVDGNLLPVEPECEALVSSNSEWFHKRESFLSQATLIRTPAADDLTPAVQRVMDRSRQDVADLRLYDLDEGEHNWKLAAGIPTYLALFGRDMLAAAWQASMLSTDMSRGALDIMAKMQTRETNDWRDAQPGRMLHEAHTDPLSVLNFTPQALYFGTANVPFLYPIVVSEVWHWTGDKDLIRPFIRPALEALHWADQYCRDESGFYKYNKRSEQGVKNQGWKDSSDAIVYPDGSQVEDPLGTCELQAFAYAAKLHLAEVLWWLDETEQGRRLYREADELKKRFNDRFWMPEENYVAMAIDKDNQLVKTIASDPGHCVTAGILDKERAPKVVNRMLQSDMFSGWGFERSQANTLHTIPFPIIVGRFGRLRTAALFWEWRDTDCMAKCGKSHGRCLRRQLSFSMIGFRKCSEGIRGMSTTRFRAYTNRLIRRRRGRRQRRSWSCRHCSGFIPTLP